jgi:hypothetical protein
VPRLNVQYVEKGTGQEWWLTCGGTRGYAARVGAKIDTDAEGQAADSHFMMRRVTCSLLLGGAGLFQAEACGRVILRSITGQVEWSSELDNWPDPAGVATPDPARVYDWCKAIVSYPALRRAAHDAHLALSNPHEALIYVYRGLEWLVVGLGRNWNELAEDIGVPASELRHLKKTANVDTGVRHATEAGLKMRAQLTNYGSWVYALFLAINAARGRLEPGFRPMEAEQVADLVARAVPVTAYE